MQGKEHQIPGGAPQPHLPPPQRTERRGGCWGYAGGREMVSTAPLPSPVLPGKCRVAPNSEACPVACCNASACFS